MVLSSGNCCFVGNVGAAFSAVTVPPDSDAMSDLIPAIGRDALRSEHLIQRDRQAFTPRLKITALSANATDSSRSMLIEQACRLYTVDNHQLVHLGDPFARAPCKRKPRILDRPSLM